MKPSDELIEKFREQYQKEYGEEISLEQARDQFMRLASLIRIVLKPRPTKNPGTMFPGVFIPGIDDYPQDGNIKNQ